MLLLKLKVRLQLLLGNATEGAPNPCCKPDETSCSVITAVHDWGESVSEALLQLHTVEAPPSVPHHPSISTQLRRGKVSWKLRFKVCASKSGDGDLSQWHYWHKLRIRARPTGWHLLVIVGGVWATVGGCSTAWAALPAREVKIA